MTPLSRLFLASAVLASVVCAAPAPSTRSFRAGPLIPVGPRPVAVVLADFNGDQALDLASADSGANTVSVVYGDGRGGFAGPHSFEALPSPHLLAVAEVNGDGRPDLFVSAHDSNDVAVLLNQGQGFARRTVTVFSAGKGHNHGLASADVNGDGNADLTAGHQDLSRIAVLLGDGQGGFRPAPESLLTTGASPYPHTMADLNGDRKPDLVVPSVQGNTIDVFLGAGNARLTSAGSASTGIARPYFVTTGDFTGDGKLDLAVSHDDTSRLAVLIGDGRGGFRHAPGSPFDAGRRGWTLAAGDLSGDGKLDLAMAGDRVIQLFYGDGHGRFVRGPKLLPAADGWQVIAADLNRDGKLDLVAPATDRDAVQVFLAE